METKMHTFEQQHKDLLDTLKKSKQKEAQEAAGTFREDEAKFAKIELNIIEIFETLFTASLKQASANSESGENAWIDGLEKSYRGYFTKIPTSWQATLKQCEQFGKEEGAHIERLKIAQAELIEAAFVVAAEHFRSEL